MNRTLCAVSTCIDILAWEYMPVINEYNFLDSLEVVFMEG